MDVIFGEVCTRRNQTVAIAGDLLRDLETGEVSRFVARESDVLVLEEVEAGLTPMQDILDARKVRRAVRNR